MPRLCSHKRLRQSGSSTASAWSGANVYLGAELDRLRRLPLTPGSKAEPQYQPQVHSWACIGGTSCPLWGSSQTWDIEYVHPGTGLVLVQHNTPSAKFSLSTTALARARSKSVVLPLMKLGMARAGYLSLRMSSCSWHSVKRRWNRRFCPMTGSSSFSSSLFRRPTTVDSHWLPVEQ